MGSIGIDEAGAAQEAGGPPAVELKNIRRAFDGGRIEALRDLSLSINHGEFVVIAGPSGCGKSTLLNLMGVLDEPDEGEVLFSGQRLRGVSERTRFRSREVGFVFQSFHLLPTLTALENVQIPMFEMPWPRRERIERARHLLDEVGLAARLNHLPSELSGGERQRVAAARSLANNPRLILADEPTGNLDSGSAAQVAELLASLHSRKALTLVVVTHDQTWEARAGRVVRMRDGKVVSDTSPRPGP